MITAAQGSNKHDQNDADDLNEALHFLANIPMGGEGHSEAHTAYSTSGEEDQSSNEEGSEMVSTSHKMKPLLVPGNQNFVTVIPRRQASQASVDNQPDWELKAVRQGVLDGRMFFSTRGDRGVRGWGYPRAVFSLIPYTTKRRAQTRKMTKEDDIDVSPMGMSTTHLLHASWGPCSWIRDQEDEHPIYNEPPYHPDFLDDPEIRQSKQRTVIHLDGYLQTTIPYVKRHQLEEQLNVQFRQKHPWMPLELTLSKIRRLKRRTLRLGLEIGTVALAHVLFEKLVLQRRVQKDNYKKSMAACVLLAFKFNEPTAGAAVEDSNSCLLGDERPKNPAREKLLEKIEQHLSVAIKEVVRAEYGTFAALRFGLYVPPHEVDTHFKRLLKATGRNPADYLGKQMYEQYKAVQVGVQRTPRPPLHTHSATLDMIDELTI